MSEQDANNVLEIVRRTRFDPLQYLPRTVLCLSFGGVEHNVDVVRDVLKSGFPVLDRLVHAQFTQKA